MPPGLKRVLAIVVAVAVSAGGAYWFKRYEDRMSGLSEQSVEWPSVPGLITHSNLEARRRKTGTPKTTTYRVEVTYEYVVAEQVYRNDVVRFDQGNLSRKRKELLVGAYPVGRKVDVFYNPEQPKQSVLVRGSYRRTE